MTSKNKKLMNFTIDKEIITKFLIITKKKCINKSQLVEMLIKKWIQDNDK